MRLTSRLAILGIIVLCIWMGMVRCSDFLKERYVYRFINSRLKNYVATKWNACLYIGKIKGNLFTDLELENVLLKGLKNYPEELEFACESAGLSYSPLKIFSGELNIEFESPKITYKNMVLPLDIYHRGRITTVTFKKRFARIEEIKEILPKDVYFAGPVNLEGEIVLKNFNAHLIDINVKSQDCYLGFEGSLKARGSANLEVSGHAKHPQVSGRVDISSIYLSNGLSGLSLFKSQTTNIESEFLKKSVFDIDVSGGNVVARDRYINTLLDMDLNLRKERAERPHLIGKIDIKKGTYHAFDNKFQIAKGKIVFVDKDKSPSIDIEAETKIRRYKIFASTKGTLEDSRLVLFSKPELSRAEITSLLVFGKRMNDLSILQRSELTKKDFNNVLINNFFFGKAETTLAKVIGVDDINLQFDTEEAGNGSLKPPSVEVGKYIVDQRLYGTYKMEPNKNPGQLSEQVVKGELELSDSIVVGGERHWQQSWRTPREDKVDIKFRWKF